MGLCRPGLPPLRRLSFPPTGLGLYFAAARRTGIAARTPAWACTLLPPAAAAAFAALCRPEFFIAARRTGMGLYGCLTDVGRTRLLRRGGALDGGANACASGGGASGGASGGGARGNGAGDLCILMDGGGGRL